MPAHLRFNRYVHSGYRCGLSTAGCCASVGGWHNESLNIWTHLGAALVAAYALAVPWAPAGAPGVHAALRCAAALPMLLSFVLSVCYHTFMAHAQCSTAPDSQRRYEQLLRLDVCGVVSVLSVPQLAIVWYGFHNAAPLRAALWASMAAVTVVGARATSSVDQTARARPLGLLVAVRWAALALRLAGHGAPCAPALAWYARMELLVAAGGAANATFFPERFLPGRLDCILNRQDPRHRTPAPHPPHTQATLTGMRSCTCHAALQPPDHARVHHVCVVGDLCCAARGLRLLRRRHGRRVRLLCARVDALIVCFVSLLLFLLAALSAARKGTTCFRA